MTNPVQIPDAAVQALEALKKAEMFIENGVEYGFIRLPEKPDPALDTLPKIKAAIEVLTNEGTKPVDVAAVRKAAELACMYLANDFIECDRCGHEVETKNTDAEYILRQALSAEPAQGARPLEEWHEDHGNVVWWAWDNDRQAWLGEPAYIGKPLDSDWPEYHTHWTPHPTFPAAPIPEAEA